MSSIFRMLAVCVVLSVQTTMAYSAQIVLNNDDIVSGVLVSNDGDTVVWQSTIFGQISIPVSQVRRILTDAGGRDNSSTPSAAAEPVEQNDSNRSIEEFIRSLIPSGQISLHVNGHRGDVDRDNYEMETKLSWDGKSIDQELDLDYRFETRNSNKVLDELEANYQITRPLAGRWFAAAHTDYVEDDFRGIDRRWQTGASVGYQLVQTTYSRLRTTLGAHYNLETHKNRTKREGEGWRIGVDYRRSFQDSPITTFYKQTVTGSVSPSKDIESRLSVGLSYPITDRFNSTISFDWDYDNHPAFGASKSNRLWTVGVGSSW